MDADLKDRIRKLWRRFLMVDTPDAAYLEAIDRAQGVGEETAKTLNQFRHELDGVTFRVEKRHDVA